MKLLGRGASSMTSRFYNVQLPKHPELAVHFRDVGLEQQAALLTIGLQAIVWNHTRQSPPVQEYLITLGTLHDRRAIPRDLHPEFANLLIDTLQSYCKDDWDAHLERDWREARDRAIELMLSGYAN